jgi:catechol 2,3-dioxygenase-like lactoylglutathione lyase family enzyme
MITGSHVVIYTEDAEADRAFFRDVLRMPAVDAGHGWLIFALPPAEVAFHPSDSNGTHELYLTCDDLDATMEQLKAHDVQCDPPSDEGWGIVTRLRLPGGGGIGLYQPTHPRASA